MRALCEHRFQQYFSYIMVTSFNGGRSQSTRRESPTMDKQLVYQNKKHTFNWLNTLHVTFTIRRYRLGCLYRLVLPVYALQLRVECILFLYLQCRGNPRRIGDRFVLSC
jgi:hypothetical protein